MTKKQFLWRASGKHAVVTTSRPRETLSKGADGGIPAAAAASSLLLLPTTRTITLPYNILTLSQHQQVAFCVSVSRLSGSIIVRQTFFPSNTRALLCCVVTHTHDEAKISVQRDRCAAHIFTYAAAVAVAVDAFRTLYTRQVLQLERATGVHCAMPKLATLGPCSLVSLLVVKAHAQQPCPSYRRKSCKIGPAGPKTRLYLPNEGICCKPKL